MIGTINLKFFYRETQPWTESGVREAGLKFPHEQRPEIYITDWLCVSVGGAGSYPLSISRIHWMLERESFRINEGGTAEYAFRPYL